jgi:putative acetyltransferase
MPYTITAIEEAEHPLLVPIWESAVLATHHFLKDSDFQIFKLIVSSGIFKSVETLKGARDPNGKLVAFMGIKGQSLEMLFVQDGYRGKGIGKMLLKSAIEDLGVRTVDVNQQNEAAVGFYLHFGFEITSVSAKDGMGKPYPIAHMQLVAQLDMG